MYESKLYLLEDRIRISSLGRVKNCLHVVQIDSGTHQISSPMITLSIFTGVKAAGT
jgi:hypothetical protein